MSDDVVEPAEASPENRISRRHLLKGAAAVAGAAAAVPLLGGPAGAATAASKSFGSYSTRRSVKKTQLTLMSWEPFEPPEIAAWKHITSTFTQKTGIGVTWTGWPFANYDANVIAQAEAGHIAADVVQCPPELGSTLIQLFNLCEPVGDIAKEVGLVPNPAHKQFELNGKLYLLGILEVAFLLAYDKRMLHAGGFSGPPETAEAWLEMTKKLTHGNQYGTLLINDAAAGNDSWNTLQNFPLGFGGEWAKGRNLTIDSKENIKAVQFYVDLVKASGLAGTVEAELDKLWYNDQIATDFTVGFGAASLKAIAPKLFPHLASGPAPWAGHKAIARLHGNVVLKTSKHQAAAMELCKWMIEPSNLWYVTKQNGYPVIPYSNFGQVIKGYDGFQKASPWYGGFTGTNYVGEANILGDYVFAYTQIGDLIGQNVVKAISGSATVTEALQAAQAQAKSSIHLPR